jgi:very-short-patch-repair endonuclease
LETNRNLCESGFERAVFDQISSKGYKVILQHKVAGYRIDLVVEGEKGRIAVECDGDEWHGPDRYEYDMNRQRILERCGWKFWRVRGSEYYYDPEKALNSLWDTLEYYNIKATFNEKVNETNDDTVILIQETSIPKKIVNTKDEQTQDIVDPNLKDTKIHHNKKKNTNKKQTLKKDINNFTGEQIEFFFNELNGFHQQKSIFDDEDDSIKPNTTISIYNLIKEQPFDLKDFLLSKRYEVIDKRNNGRSLWLVGGKELSPLVKEKKSKKFTFHIPKKVVAQQRSALRGLQSD